MSDLGTAFSNLMRGFGAAQRTTSYCDYIAHRIGIDLTKPDREGILKECGPIGLDLHPTGKYLLSSKRTLIVTDRNGNKYRVTVEDMRQ